MIKIRLRRTGATKQPHYRIVVADARAPRDGKYIDLVGHYDPLTNPATITVDADKAAKWVGQGAQMTETVQKLFARAGVLEQVKPSKQAKEVVAEPEPAKPAPKRTRTTAKKEPAAKKES